MKKLIILTLLFSVLPYIAIGAPGEIKWGEIPDEILHRKYLPQDTSAIAATLFDIGEIEIVGFSITSKRHVRIQVFKEEGKKHANIRIPFSPIDIVYKINAQVILPNGNKIKLKKKNIFNEGEKGKWRFKVFTIPGVDKNCIIEYQYNIDKKNFVVLDPWLFQSDIFTELSRLSITVPEGYIYNVYLRNSPIDPYKPNKENLMYYRQKYVKYTWEFRNLEPIRIEPYMTTVKDYVTALNFQLVGFGKHKFIKTWEDIRKGVIAFYKPYFSECKQVRRLRETIIDDVIGNETSKTAKAKLIYNFVRDSIETGEYRGYAGAGIRKPKVIIKKRKGSGVEKNLLLISLLRSAGIEADPMLISTRSNGKWNTRYPKFQSFNHLITSVDLSPNNIFLDTGGSYCPFELLPYNDHVGVGLILNEEGTKIKDIPPPISVSMYYSNTKAEIDESGALKAQTNIRFEGYRNIIHREQLEQYKETEDFVKEKVLNNIKNISIDTCWIDKKLTKEEPLFINISYSISNFADVVGEYIYFSPALCQRLDKNPFKLEKRSYPIEYPYPYMDSEEIIIELPEGYEIIELPSFCRYPRKGQRFDRIIKKENNSLHCSRRLYVKELTYIPRQYEKVKGLYSLIVKADQDQVVLKKNR